MQGDSVTMSNFLMEIVAVSLSFLLIWSCRQVHTDRRLLSERTSREAAESLRRLQKSKCISCQMFLRDSSRQSRMNPPSMLVPLGAVASVGLLPSYLIFI